MLILARACHSFLVIPEWCSNVNVRVMMRPSHLLQDFLPLMTWVLYMAIWALCANVWLLFTAPHTAHFFLQERVTCAPQTNPSDVSTTPRTWTPTGQWAARPAHRAPSRLSSHWRVSCRGNLRTSSNPSWSQSSAAASSPARPFGYCSIRKLHTPLSRCSPTSQTLSSWTLAQWGDCTRWKASR